MAVKLTSYISFDGNAKEAMEFYRSVFGGTVYSDTFASFASSDMPVAEADMDKIMHASLVGSDGIELMASDTPTGIDYETGARITLTLSGASESTLRDYWNKLAEGGKVTAPLQTAPWGDTFGMLVDKFGVNWMVNIGPEGK